MRKILLACIALTTFAFSSCCYAELDESIYKVKLTVNSRDAKIRQDAFIESLRQILVKVSGNSDWAKSQTLVSTLNDPTTVIDCYSYQEFDDAGDANQTLLKLRIYFDPQRITALLKGVNQAAWQGDRPTIVVWLAVDNSNSVFLIGQDSNGALPDLIRNNAKRRDVELLLPGLDLVDLNAVSIKDVWIPNNAVLIKAAKRYDSDTLLVGRLRWHDQMWQTSWSLIAKGVRTNWETSGSNLPTLLASSIDKAVDTIAAQHVSVEKEKFKSSQMLLAVSNIKTVSDYTKLLDYLKKVRTISRMELVLMQPNQVIFRLNLVGGGQDLQKKFATDGLMLPLKTNISVKSELVSLNYQWSP